MQDDRGRDLVGRYPGVLAREAPIAGAEVALDVLDHDPAAPSGAEPGGVEQRLREAVRIERERRPRVDRRQLLEDEGAREGAEVLGAGETEAGELAHQPARHAAGPLVGAQPRQQAVAGEAARRVLDQALLVGEREGEHAALLVTPRGSGASCGRRRINRWISRARSA